MAHRESFIRWAGGKSWLVPVIKEMIANLDYNDYYEPFMGGASIFFALDPQNDVYLSDINMELVNAFCAVKDNPKRVIYYLKQMKSNEAEYYSIRDEIKKGKQGNGKYQKAARFLYLNENSYNGLYRVNRNGKYNVPYGKQQKQIEYDRIMDASIKLQNVHITCNDFSKIEDDIRENDLIFLDPPYAVTKEDTGFIAYNSKLFSLDDQKVLSHLVDAIDERGAYYIMTNAAHPSITEIFGDQGNMRVIERNSLIGGKKAYRGNVREYLFTNIPERNE